jgi:hypothetical protein
MRCLLLPSRSVVWLALGCHLLIASGLPLAVPRAPAGDDAPTRVTKDRSRPFPCMDKPCGCATAEQCFAHCCCHTPAQRLAWAKAHRVEPAVLAALERRVAAQAKAPAGCCATADEASPCCTETDDVDLEAPDVCRDYRSLAADPVAPSGDTGEPEPRAQRTVILRDMLACGGIVTAWLTCGAALPPPPRITFPVGGACVGVVLPGDDVAPSVSVDLSTPPPRAA